jgi:hydrogenase maturation protease
MSAPGSCYDAPQARVLIGGIGYRWMRDASFGVVASDALACLEWPKEVKIEDLGYGALWVAQDLDYADPPYDRLILIAAVNRGRAAGVLYRSEWDRTLPPEDEILERIREAGAGVVDLDHLLVIAQQQDVLPQEVILYEVEPEDRSPGVELGPSTAPLLPALIAQIRRDAVAPFNRQPEAS